MACDPVGDTLRDRDEALHAAWRARADVKGAQVGDQGASDRSAQPLTEIGVYLVPDVAHRGVAVTKVDGAQGGTNALRHGVARRQDKVVVLQAEVLDGPREKRQELAVVARSGRESRKR